MFYSFRAECLPRNRRRYGNCGIRGSISRDLIVLQRRVWRFGRFEDCALLLYPLKKNKRFYGGDKKPLYIYICTKRKEIVT